MPWAFVIALGLFAWIESGPVGATEPPPAPDTTHVTPPADSSGVPINTIDPRGVPFELRARRILLTGAIDSVWVPDSAQAQTLPSTLRYQRVPDGVGGTFVGWVDDRTGEPDVYLQHYTADGTIAPDWPVGGMVVAGGPMSQYHLDIAPDGAGGVYLVWEDYRAGSGDIYAARVTGAGLNADGWPVGGKIVCAAEGLQAIPSVTGSGDGAYVSWQDSRSGVRELYLQRLDGSGEPSPGWSEGGVRVIVAEAPIAAPALFADSAGKSVVLWKHEGASSKDLLALPVSSDPPSSGVLPVAVSASADELGDVGVAASGSNRLILAWSEWRGGEATLRTATLNLDSPSLVQGGPGGAALQSGSLGRSAPVLVAEGEGGVIAWEDFGTDESVIRLQRFTVSGQRDAAWAEAGMKISSSGENGYAAGLATDGAGALFVTWNTVPDSASDQRLATELRMAALRPGLVSAKATPGHVHIIWQARSALVSAFDVDRRTGDAEWQMLVRVSLDPAMRVVVDDRTVADGSHVEYRLSYRDSVGTVFLLPVALDVPVAPAVLTLKSVIPRGREHALTVVFALPRGPTPRLELIDVMGRRVASNRLDGMEPGEHSVQFSLPATLPAGVYFLRLIQGNERRVAKTVYLR